MAAAATRSNAAALRVSALVLTLDSRRSPACEGEVVGHEHVHDGDDGVEGAVFRAELGKATAHVVHGGLEDDFAGIEGGERFLGVR